MEYQPFMSYVARVLQEFGLECLYAFCCILECLYVLVQEKRTPHVISNIVLPLFLSAFMTLCLIQIFLSKKKKF